MSAAPSGPLLGWREQTAAGRGGVGGVQVGIGKPVERRADDPMGDAPIARAALAHRVGQGDQVVVVGMDGQGSGVAHEVPSAGCGDPAGMADTQIPRMRFARGSEWPHHCRRVRVDERQGRHGIVRTPRPATATRNVHDRKAIVDKRRQSAGHAHPPDPRCATVTIGPNE